MKYFLVIFDRRESRLLADVQAYASKDGNQALADRFSAEDIWRENPNVEVVVLTAESREQLERTHGRYFGSKGQLLSSP